MSIKDDDGFMDVFSRYTMGTGDMSVDYYTRSLSQEDFETNQTSLMTELIEYIDKYVEKKVEDEIVTTTKMFNRALNPLFGQFKKCF